MKVTAVRTLSKQGKEYTKMTAVIRNFYDPGNPGEIGVSMSDNARDHFAQAAKVEIDEAGNEMMVMYVNQAESKMELRADTWEKGKPPARKLHLVEIVDGEAPEIREYKDVFAKRDELKPKK